MGLSRSIDPRALWSRRELLLHLFWRDVKQRYKQTALGILWAVAQPLTMVAALTFTFDKLAQLPSHGFPYPIFVLSGLLGWQLMSRSITGVTRSIIANRVIVERIYCPRLLLPLSATLTGVFDFAIALVLFFGMAAFYGIALTWSLLWLPLLVILTVLVSLSLGLWCAVLGVWYRDVKFVVDYAMRLLIFVTPVGFATDVIPEGYEGLVTYNPLAGVIELFRASLLGTDITSPTAVVWSLGISAVLLIGGLIFFAKAERTFADVI